MSINWCDRADSNRQHPAPQAGDSTSWTTIACWWIHGESNPNLRHAEALCSRYHYGP